MKKIIYSIVALCTAILSLSSCEDVPMPYDYPKNGNGGTTVIEPAGDGTQANPFNVAAILDKVTAMSADQTSEAYYVKGIVTSMADNNENGVSQYGNMTYYISDDAAGTNKIMIYQSYYLGNVRYTSTDQLKVGDEVVIYSQWVNYRGNTPETTGRGTAYIYSLNGNTAPATPETPGTTAGSGTQADPYNVYGAIEQIKNLATTDTLKNVFVKGKVVSVSSVDTTRYYNATFYISDDGTTANQLYCFRVKNLENTNFSSASQVAVGDEVIVTGEWVYYNGNTPETNANKAYIYSRNGNTKADTTPVTPDTPSTSEGITISGTTVTLTNADVTAGTETVTLDLNTLGLAANAVVSGPYSFSDGATLTVSKGSSTSNPIFHSGTKGFRIYKNNELTFSASKKIAKIEFECDSYNNTNYVGNATATVSFSETGAVYVNKFTDNGGGTQLRVKTITITYAQ